MINIMATGVSEEVMRVLESQGLQVNRSLDIEVPPFPRDITLVDDQTLMILASQYMENFNFMRTQVACAALAEMEAENAYSLAEAKAFLTLTSGKTTEKATMLKSAVITSPDIAELAQGKTYAYAYRKMLETTMDNLERYYSLVSRELTRRNNAVRSRF
ncbi:hypothetical protein UFOVP965_61 [uncultured Caudovirales phage]|uniref:Uncharacterized protein n=1 Tax=uncultured Caudovirales phage TaxID=2100421 RepID=A0A6J5Q8J5_9CAUD|nr:hypothetical protein UFOVP965_61 [uncultured Caudovirales phage]CAB4179802.1 hypothetical protein UFOVP1035_57 [uncultured Caudovirales phage]CAB4188385.1 hypothetical protein UFOVP1181_16 [uncultured Caudovirales phage]